MFDDGQPVEMDTPGKLFDALESFVADKNWRGTVAASHDGPVDNPPEEVTWKLSLANHQEQLLIEVPLGKFLVRSFGKWLVLDTASG